MTSPDVLKHAAETFLPEDTVLAAGIFGLQDNYVTVAAVGLAGAATADAVGLEGPLASGVVGAASIHAARDINADSQGLAVRMLIAVTVSTIHVLDWDGSVVHKEFMAFDRASTDVTVTKFGASRRVHLKSADGKQELDITGSTGFLSSEAAADKLVLELLYG